MKKVSDMKYMVRFNNRVGNVGAHTLAQALQSAHAIVNYKYAEVAMILRKVNGKFRVIQIIR